MTSRVVAWASLLAAITTNCAVAAECRQISDQWTWIDANGHEQSAEELRKRLAVFHTARANDLEQLKLANGAVSLARLDLSNSDFSRLSEKLDFSDVMLDGANFRSANVGSSSFAGAQLRKADFTGACAWGADFSYAQMHQTHLLNADLSYAKLIYATFEPETLPLVDGAAFAVGLETLTYTHNPSPIMRLRKVFQDAGFLRAERQVTAAIKRTQTRKDRDACVYHWRGVVRLEPLEFASACVDSTFNTVMFDWTSEFGAKPGRPLLIMWGLGVAMIAVYFAFLHGRGQSGLMSMEAGVSPTRIERPRFCPYRGRFRRLKWWTKQEGRLFLWAAYFSLISAFNIGFRDINFGRWVRLITPFDIDLQPTGWMRTASGVQALSSVYLLALWVLTYFGRPFQ